MRVSVYWNTHKRCWSIRADTGERRGTIIHHARMVILEDCTFWVSEVRRQRVLLRRQKNVHAFVRGILVDHGEDVAADCTGRRVSYNPYKGPCFVTEDGDNIHKADRVYMAEDRRVYAA